MGEVLPTHYAWSEVLIVIAALYAVVRAWAVNRWFAVGLAAAAVAALVAIVRIVGGLTGDIIVLHEFLSRYGALFGLGCIFGALLGRSAWLPPVVGVVAAALTVAFPTIHLLLLVGLILGCAALAFRGVAHRRFVAAGSFAILLFAGVVSAPFRAEHPALGWHIFHVMVALWYVLVAAYVTGSLLANRERDSS